MARRLYSPEEIARALERAERQIARGLQPEDAALLLGIKYSTLRRWRRRFRATDRTKRLQALEKENALLRKAVAELDLPP